MPSVFFSYSHADEGQRDQLEKQLTMLKRQGIIDTWHDRRIGAGHDIDNAIDEHINSDAIILLLVSADFLASDYCYNIELKRAMERHDAGDAVVIPVILRACDWHSAPFGKLRATPRDGRPITQWPDIDEAYLQVATAVRDTAERLDASSQPSPKRASGVTAAKKVLPASAPRSSNLRVAKTFTQRDKDQFQLDTFEYLAKFFENSLAEIGARNPGIEGVFRRVDANRFFASIYRDGKDVSRATVFFGTDAFARGINFVPRETTQSNTFHESLIVQPDEQTLYLSSMGMTGSRNQKLSTEGAAELFWALLIQPLQ